MNLDHMLSDNAAYKHAVILFWRLTHGISTEKMWLQLVIFIRFLSLTWCNLNISPCIMHWAISGGFRQWDQQMCSCFLSFSYLRHVGNHSPESSLHVIFLSLFSLSLGTFLCLAALLSRFEVTVLISLTGKLKNTVSCSLFSEFTAMVFWLRIFEQINIKADN